MTEQADNTSGHGKEAILPDTLRGWNWGAFLLNGIWGIGNSTYIALLMFIPVVNFVMPFVLGAKGNKWAWANRTWRDEVEFRRVQRNWAIAGFSLVTLFIVGSGGFFYGVNSLFKNSPAYLAAVEELRRNPRAVDLLGQPVETGHLVLGNLKSSDSSGEATLTFSVAGPKADGQVYTVSIKENGEWRLEELILDIQRNGQPVDLLR